MILDATAGNRTMWQHKNSANIIYIDLERKLTVKPTIFTDNSSTPFLDLTFDAIFYDPPHGWGKGHPFYKYPDAKSFKEKWKGYGDIPRYYGWDKNKNRTQLIGSIFRAQREFYRILKDDGLLWLKWNEVMIPINNILAIFKDWHILIELVTDDPTHTAGYQKTYWVCMQKKTGNEKQPTLLQFQLSNNNTHVSL